jgi:hypothetical protein
MTDSMHTQPARHNDGDDDLLPAKRITSVYARRNLAREGGAHGYEKGLTWCGPATRPDFYLGARWEPASPRMPDPVIGLPAESAAGERWTE